MIFQQNSYQTEQIKNLIIPTRWSELSHVSRGGTDGITDSKQVQHAIGECKIQFFILDKQRGFWIRYFIIIMFTKHDFLYQVIVYVR